jgi:hypothetical protein
MAHYLFNLSEPEAAQVSLREQAATRLRVNMWGVDADEPHRDSLAPGDLILIYLAEPERAFVGHAELVSAVHEWTPSEAQAYPGVSPCGVLLSGVEEWDPPLLMDTVLPRIDPDGSNPYVKANAKAGFQSGIVRITPAEYEAVLAVRAEQSLRTPD